MFCKAPLTMLLGAVDAVTGGFRREDMFRYLKTGMAGITAEECDLLENYVILWSIRGICGCGTRNGRQTPTATGRR